MALTKERNDAPFPDALSNFHSFALKSMKIQHGGPAPRSRFPGGQKGVLPNFFSAFAGKKFGSILPVGLTHGGKEMV